MKVLVLSNRVPFVHGGAEELSSNLVQQLRLAGHEAEDIRLPFSWTPHERLYDEMLIARQLRIANVDRVIALKFPAYLVEHHCKVVWLLHQYRQAYDLFDASISNIPNDVEGKSILRAIRTADAEALGGAHRLFALPEAHRRLNRYNGIPSEMMATPLNDPELFCGSETDGGYIFVGGRISQGKRQELLIEALAFAPRVRMLMAGPVETEDYAKYLEKKASDLGVADRIDFRLQLHSRARIAEFVNGSIASAYIPYDEDNYGYVTLEAFSASKPVIAASDAGAVLDIVINGETGLVAEPVPELLGRAMETVSENRLKARQLGKAGKDSLEKLDLNWHSVIARLLS